MRINRKKYVLIGTLALLAVLIVTVAAVIALRRPDTETVLEPLGVLAEHADEQATELQTETEKGYTYFSNGATDKTHLCYEEQYQKNAFYVVYVDYKNVVLDSFGKATVSLVGRNEADINAERVFQPRAVSGDASFRQIVKTDEEGILRLVLTFSQVTSAGVQVRALPVEEDATYTLVRATDGTVRMVFATEDVKESGLESATLTRWADKYATMRKDFLELCGGGEPYAGTTDYVLTEELSYLALAGDPIYVNRQHVSQFLAPVGADAVDFSDVAWELVHEMSHTFDGIDGSDLENVWSFDAEFFANVKMVYVLDKNAYFTEKSYEAYVSTLAELNWLDRNIYTSQGFTYLFLAGVRDDKGVYLAPMKDLFAILRCNGGEILTESEQFLAFESAFSEAYGSSLSGLFKRTEYATVKGKFNT